MCHLKGVRYMLRKLFQKLKEYRSTGTSIHLSFSYLFFLSANPWSITAHIVLCKGLPPGKRVSRGRSAHSNQCDRGWWDCRGTYPEDIPSPLFHGVLLPQNFILLPRASLEAAFSASSSASFLVNVVDRAVFLLPLQPGVPGALGCLGLHTGGLTDPHFSVEPGPKRV